MKGDFAPKPIEHNRSLLAPMRHFYWDITQKGSLKEKIVIKQVVIFIIEEFSNLRKFIPNVKNQTEE